MGQHGVAAPAHAAAECRQIRRQSHDPTIRICRHFCGFDVPLPRAAHACRRACRNWKPIVRCRSCLGPTAASPIACPRHSCGFDGPPRHAARACHPTIGGCQIVCPIVGCPIAACSIAACPTGCRFCHCCSKSWSFPLWLVCIIIRSNIGSDAPAWAPAPCSTVETILPACVGLNHRDTTCRHVGKLRRSKQLFHHCIIYRCRVSCGGVSHWSCQPSTKVTGTWASSATAASSRQFTPMPTNGPPRAESPRPNGRTPQWRQK